MSCYGTKPPSFLKIQPGGQIPVAIIKGKTYGQSNDILMALEEEFPNHSPPLMPDENDRQKMTRAQELFALERQLFSAWMGWLTGRGGGKANFERVLQYVDSVLLDANDTGGGPFFMGQSVSMVDIQFASFLERMAASMVYFKGYMIRVPKGRQRASFPGINAWFDAMEELPAYQLTKSDYYTHCWDLPPQLGGCTSEPEGKIYQDAINGIKTLDGTRGSWELPLQKDNGGVEPDWDWAASDDATARREAVERVSSNHEAIVKFACRGA
jgi:glutathione S-transferase